MIPDRPPRVLLLLIVIAGCAARCWSLERLAIEHFDEGVYASNLYAGHLDNQYPDRPLYAPPLFPGLIEWVMILARGDAASAMWPNLALGALLIVAVWWTTREAARALGGWLAPRPNPNPTAVEGPQLDFADCAALAAAALVAGSDLLIQYSRAALTDTPVCLAMVFALGAAWRGGFAGDWRWIGVAAVSAAAGWWTKYNGWLPLAVLAAGWFAWLICDRPGWTAARDLGVRWAALIVGAVAIWLPYLAQLAPIGGYAAVARNHAGYVVGWSGWLDGVTRHWLVDRHYTQAATAAGVFLAINFAGVGWRVAAHPEASHWRRLAATTGVYLASLASLVVVLTCGFTPWLVLGGLPLWYYGIRRRHDRSVNRLPWWCLLAWMTSLTLTTPLYTPYPRLILPWLIGGAMTAGLGWTLLARELANRWGGAPAPPPLTTTTSDDAIIRRSQRIRPVIVLAMLLLFPVSPAWQDRRGLELAAEQIVAVVQSDLLEHPQVSGAPVRCGVYVLGAPGLYFHLAARENGVFPYITQPAANFGMLAPGAHDASLPGYVVIGPATPAELTELSSRMQGTRQVAALSYLPSDLVLLDKVPPAGLEEHRRQSLQIWRIEPGVR